MVEVKGMQDSLSPRVEGSQQVFSATSDGHQTCLTRIEGSVTRGFSGIKLIGHMSEVCRDGKERAKAALERCGLFIPAQSLVISLTPADLKKDGNQFDLGLATVLAGLIEKKAPAFAIDRWLFAAELGLGGELRPVCHIVSYAICAAQAGLDGIVYAAGNHRDLVMLQQQAKFKNLRFVGLEHLEPMLAWLRGLREPPTRVEPVPSQTCENLRDFDDMHMGKEVADVAMTSAAGGHSLLLRGVPGTGKTMLAERIGSLLPPLRRSDHLECLRIHSSVSSTLPSSLLAGRPPFRRPHHQASAAAILGSDKQPGELPLALGGVLFLDEINEFRRDVLEGLREPLEAGWIRVSRAKRKYAWPCRCLFIAACNNCPCGWRDSQGGGCDCSPRQLLAYRQRLSGPILQRIDMHVLLPRFDCFKHLKPGGYPGQTDRLRKKVEQARQMSEARNREWGCRLNRDLAPHVLLTAAGWEIEEFRVWWERARRGKWTNRGITRLLRLARTLADLEAVQKVSEAHLCRALAWQPESVSQQLGESYSRS